MGWIAAEVLDRQVLASQQDLPQVIAAMDAYLDRIELFSVDLFQDVEQLGAIGQDPFFSLLEIGREAAHLRGDALVGLADQGCHG